MTGTNQRANYAFAQTMAAKLKRIPGLVDLRIQQKFDAPTLKVNVDRSRAQAVGLSTRDVAQNVLLTLSSSFQTAPLFFVDPKNGANYPLAIQTPQYRITSMDDLERTPIRAGSGSPQILSNVAGMTPMISNRLPSRSIVIPTTAGSSPKRRRHRPSLITTVPALSGCASASVNGRPRAGATRRTSK